MAINLFYNYYQDQNLRRGIEIDACCRKIAENKAIDNFFILREPHITVPVERFHAVDCSPRPLLSEIFNQVTVVSANRDCNIVLNSDCFLDDRDTAFIGNIGDREAYCLSRIEIRSAFPLRIRWFAERRRRKKHRDDMQDAWIFRGKPSKDLWLEFPLGKPGSDNRLAYEFKNAGYQISNPASKIRLYHFHATQVRSYLASERVPLPYAFPQIQ
jgi:hypothetical protein